MPEAIQTEPILDELQQKLEAAKERYQASKPAPDAEATPTNEPLVEWTEDRTATCEKCGQLFTYTASLRGRRLRDGTKVVDRELFKPKWCKACFDADTKARRRVDDAQAEFERATETSEQENAFRRLLHEMGANAWEHGHASLENFDTSEAGERPVLIAREFVEVVAGAGPFDPVRGLYYHGPTGTAKTHLTIGIVRELLSRGYRYPIVFDHAAELIARIQDTYGRKDASTFAVLEPRINAGLWILDDFGTERPSDDVVRHLTVIVTRRGQRPNLITSNFDPERLDAERPDLLRVLSRLGPKYFRVCPVIGRDRRFD